MGAYPVLTADKCPSRDAGKHELPVARPRLPLWGKLILLLAVCLSGYWASLGAGFLLDDLIHVDYASRAWDGDWQAFFRVFSGNWTGKTDNLTSYRPAISISFLLDYLVWRGNAFGYHLTNVLMFFGCSVLVGALAGEICACLKAPSGRVAAAAAALLFAVYPLHPESVAWIVGRVDVQCGLFYLGSMYAYLRGRLTGRRAWLAASLACFAFALPSKEMAVTLPAVLVLAEIFLLGRSADVGGAEPIGRRIANLLPFWMVLGAYAALRTSLLGTVIGGYGGSFAESWRNFADRATLLKVLIPVNEEIGAPALLYGVLPAAYTAISVIGIARLLTGALELRTILFLLGWLVVAVLPTYQIWHIYPNLVGSRLFFLSSAPFCILLAVAAIGGGEVARKQLALALRTAGALCLIALAGGWSWLLACNLEPYVVAGRQMARARDQIAAIAASTPVGKRTLFLDLPQDYKGAGMLGRPEFLEILARPPFTRTDLSMRVLTLESPVAGASDVIYPSCLAAMVASPNVHAIYKWEPQSGQFVQWKPGTGAGHYQLRLDSQRAPDLSFDPDGVRAVAADQWSATSAGAARVVVREDHITVYPAGQGVTVMLPDVSIDPMVARVVTVRVKCLPGMPPDSKQAVRNRVRLVFTSRERSSNGPSHRVEMPFDEVADDLVRVYAARHKSWTLAGRIDGLGLRFLPGDYVAEMYEVTVGAGESLIPRMRLISQNGSGFDADPHDLWLFPARRSKNALVSYDVSHIPGATGAQLLVTKSGRVFPSDSHDLQSPNADIHCYALPGLWGKILLPAKLYDQPGLHQLRIMPMTANGTPAAWPSDPQSIWTEAR
ncbi:MAG TPA: hypothetical protein V6D08_02550 [Candidatus Obscuribacterales bacterium]